MSRPGNLDRENRERVKRSHPPARTFPDRSSRRWLRYLFSMAMPRPFPATEIRDALGLVRLLYLARKVHGAVPPPGSDPLIRIGRELRASLAYAREPEGSPAYCAGIARALRALDGLEAAITLRDDLGEAARVGEARITGREIRRRGKGGRS
jgi:hypothetical protein